MRITLTLLLLTTGIISTTALAQTRTPAKSTKSNTTTSKTTTIKPAAGKASTAKPVTPRSSSTTTRPASKPAEQPATSTAPTDKDQSTTSNPIKLDIPGVEPQKAPSFNKGTVAINVGLGLGIGYGYGFNLGGSSSSSPALSLSLEKGIVEGIGPGVISVGGLLGYKSQSYEWSNYKAKWTNIYVGARGAYHYNFTANPKIDTYAGLSLAARIENYSNNFDDDALKDSYGGADLEVGIYAGGRYLLTNKLGVFTEIGYDMSYLKLGVTAKF